MKAKENKNTFGDFVCQCGECRQMRNPGRQMLNRKLIRRKGPLCYHCYTPMKSQGKHWVCSCPGFVVRMRGRFKTA